jgi:HEPN domain-containing protein
MERFGMNKTSAIEWLEKSWHNLSGAKIFYDVKHYTDVTAVELHYSIEKSLKAFLAYENKKIPKSHDLEEIYNLVSNYIDLDDRLDLLEQITKYHIAESYPAFDKIMSSLEEIKEVLDFAFEIFEQVCNRLDINKEDIK